MACSTKLLKVFALIWDIIYVLLGLGVIGIGLHVIFTFEHFEVAAIVIIAFGIIILSAALYGTVGALRESSSINKSFAVVVIMLVILQVLTVGYFWIFQTSLLINVDKTFDQLWHDQPVPVRPGNASQISSIEQWLDCCGNASYKDYLLPPKSCYNSKTDKLNLEGCRQKFLDYIAERWTTFNILVLVLVGVELICALLAYVLANSIVNRWRRSKYFPK